LTNAWVNFDRTVNEFRTNALAGSNSGVTSDPAQAQLIQERVEKMRNEALTSGQIGLFVGNRQDDLANQDDGPTPEEGHSLMLAFMTIRDSGLREALISIVTALSSPDGDL
jgi:hypothetical protein